MGAHPKTKRNPLGAGRPPKLDDANMAKFLSALRAGAPRKVAAEWADFSPRALRVWVARGREEPRSIYGKLRRSIVEAERAGEVALAGFIFRGAANDPKHAAWLLTHHPEFRKRWAATQKVEMTGKDGAPLRTVVETGGLDDLDLSKLTPEELEILERVTAKARRA